MVSFSFQKIYLHGFTYPLMMPVNIIIATDDIQSHTVTYLLLVPTSFLLTM